LTDIPSIQESKQQLREICAASAPSSITSNFCGKAAEQVRRIPGYKQVKRIFVAPDPALSQVRINCLVDGKELIMPSAALKAGFFLLTPFSIPFRDLGFAVSLKGVAKHGKRMVMTDLLGQNIDLCIGQGFAANKQGDVLGDGMGFFDLSYGILSEWGCVGENTVTCITTGEEQVLSSSIPKAPWDVQADYIVTDNEIIETEAVGQKRSPGQIFWEFLSDKRIRKITPLWQLKQQKGLT
jgi:5-formyltetrahydrofolate cyclo-ligase